MKLFKISGATRPAVVLASISAVMLSGCGSDDGPTTYEFSGNITYKGKPVPKGSITLSPDSSKGNTGPGAVAEIKDGKFATPSGAGVVGGPYVLQIQGYDGVPVQGGEGGMDETGTALFPPYEMKVDLPKEDSTKDITVP